LLKPCLNSSATVGDVIEKVVLEVEQVLMKGYSSKHKIFLPCNVEFGMIRPGICIKKLKKVLISSFIWFYNYTYLNVFSKALDFGGLMQQQMRRKSKVL